MALIRDATPDDLPELTAIYNALLETTTHEWTEQLHTVEERLEWLAAKQGSGHPALVAVEADEVIGWATYGDFRDSARWPGYRFTVEHSIHVREDCWGRGVGRTLIDALIERARSDGKHVIVAGIDSSNTGSIAFHERLGFVEVARMPEIGEKFGRRLDLVLMQRILDEPVVVTRAPAAGNSARLVLLCGLPGSGKTTTARRIAAETGGVRFCPDEWMTALAIDLFDEPARARVEALQWDLAQELLVLGQTVIIEWGVWARSERDTVRERARELGARVELVYLDVPIDELVQRIERRNNAAVAGEAVIPTESLVAWLELFEAPTAEEQALFD